MIGRVWTWLHGAASRFARHKSGNVAMIFGLSLVPMIAAGGVAVDMSRAMIVRYRLSEALDAAGLAAGRSFDQGLDAVKEVAQRYFAANYPAAELGVPGTLQVTMEGSRISLKATADVDTTLMHVVGFDYLNVGVSAEITREGKSLEIGLALDVTGSMSGQRIIDLKVAAKDLIDLVVWDQQDQFYSKVAIVPYSMGVNVGSYATQVRGPITGPKAITNAEWGKPITGATWSTGTPKNISGATPFTGTAKTITGATRANPVVITSSGHGFSNGQVVWISGVSGMTQINNKYFTVASATTNTFALSGVNGSSYSNYSSGGSVRRCQVAACDVVVTTSASHGFSNGDTVYITGVGGMTAINNRQFTVANAASTTFSLSGETGGTYPAYTSGGTVTKCTVAGCSIVISSTSHGFSNGNSVYINGVGGMTQLNGNTYTVANATANTFVLSGTDGTGYGAYTSGGRVCIVTNCPVTVTSNGHGFSNGSYVYITGVGGMTQINNNTYSHPSDPRSLGWAVANATSNTFELSGVNGSTFGAFTSGGNIHCTAPGCEYHRFTNAESTPATRVHRISTCVTERLGSDAYTDVAPATSFVGRNYPSTSNPCLTSQIVPLTTNKVYLKAQIDSFVAQGSTAGHIGLAWAWYMISPNFAYLWPSSSQAAAYGTPKVLKIAILMTDGEFNSSYCNGVISKDSTSGSGSISNKINCNAHNGHAYTQGNLVCSAMKAAGIEVYTVGFHIDTQQAAVDLMNNCATSPSHVYLTNSGAQLSAAFKAIAQDISELRLSK